jgi:hypothetical protein
MSKALVTHWKIAWSTFKKAIKVTIQEPIQIWKSVAYHEKVIDDLIRSRELYKIDKKRGLWSNEKRKNNRIIQLKQNKV